MQSENLFLTSFKVGSTTWHNHFLSLTNASARKALDKFGRDKQASMMAPTDPDIIIITITITMNGNANANGNGCDKQASMMAPTDPDIINLARSSISFSMVRHPFERIVSAYQDKVISSDLSTTSLIYVQIANWDGAESVWKDVRAICKTQFGDTSFNSFVKMLTSKNRKVSFTLC